MFDRCSDCVARILVCNFDSISFFAAFSLVVVLCFLSERFLGVIDWSFFVFQVLLYFESDGVNEGVVLL